MSQAVRGNSDSPTRCWRAASAPALVWRSSTDDPPPGGEDPSPPTPGTSTPGEVPIPSSIGHLPGLTQQKLVLWGATLSARHVGEKDQLGSLQGGLAHRDHPGES